MHSKLVRGKVNMTKEDVARQQRLGVTLVLIFVGGLVLMLASVLEAPTGEGVPPPRSACERGQSTANTVGRESWCS